MTGKPAAGDDLRHNTSSSSPLLNFLRLDNTSLAAKVPQAPGGPSQGKAMSATAAAGPCRLGRELDRECPFGWSGDRDDDLIALAFGTPVSAGTRGRICGVGTRKRLAVDLHVADRRMDAVEVQEIGARGHRPVASVAALRVDIEPDRVTALLEAEPGALELALLIVVAAAIVLVEFELAVLLLLRRLIGAEAVNVD